MVRRRLLGVFYATLDDNSAGHLYVVDEGASVCIGAVIGIGTCRGAEIERASIVAWLRLWVYGEEAAEDSFYGDDCELCSAPWIAQRKNWP